MPRICGAAWRSLPPTGSSRPPAIRANRSDDEQGRAATHQDPGRTAMAAQAPEGRLLGGRPPYGYRLADAGPHPNPSKAAAGQRAHRLEPDPNTAPVVARIFDDYVAGRGVWGIAEALTQDGVPCPSASDPKRNPHRRGTAWSKSVARERILEAG